MLPILATTISRSNMGVLELALGFVGCGALGMALGVGIAWGSTKTTLKALQETMTRLADSTESARKDHERRIRAIEALIVEHETRIKALE